MRIHHVKHTGVNNGYFLQVLSELWEEYDIELVVSKLNQYIEHGNIEADVLTYQTFPDESFEKKHNSELVKKTDKLFREFSGLKILVDSHDNGDRDAFSRFKDSKTLPRIKSFPSRRFINEYNVVMKSTFDANNPEVAGDQHKRDIIIGCKLGRMQYEHNIRDGVMERLGTDFGILTDFGWEPGEEAFIDSLKRTLISVACPGWGQHSNTFRSSLQTGALLFCHNSFNDIQYMPHYDLVDGHDFVSYNLFNFSDKLQRLLDNPKEIEYVRCCGRESFIEGYDVKRSTEQFYEYLKRELK